MTLIFALESCVIACPKIMCRGLRQNGSAPEIKTAVFHVGKFVIHGSVGSYCVFYPKNLVPCKHALDHHYLIICVSGMFNNMSLSDLW